MILYLPRRIYNVYKESFTGLSKEIWILAFVMFVNRTGSMVMAFMSLYLTDAMGWNLTNAGIVLSVFGLGSLAGSYIGGVLTDKIGFFKVQVGSMFFGGLMFWVLTGITEFYIFCIVIFLMSTILESFRPANFVAVSEYSTPENTTRSFSLVRLAINLGFAIGPALGGLLIGMVGYASLFYIDGITCILAAILLFVTMRHAERKRISNIIDLDIKEDIGVFSYWADKLYLIFIVSTMLCGIVFFQIISTVPVYMKQECGLSEQSVGFLFAYNGFLIFLVEMPLVFIFEKKYNKMLLILVGAILILLSMVSLLFMPAAWLAAFAYMTIISFGEILNFPFGNSWAANRADENHKGKFMGLYTMSFSLAFVISPALGSYVSDKFGWQSLWLSMSIISVLALLGYWLVYVLMKKEKTLIKNA